jgi:hypothetical protein
MGLKVGDTCFSVHVSDDGKVEFWEYHLRTIRRRPKGTQKIGYWFPKLPGVTWGKLSTKHGDCGWLDKNGIVDFRVAKAIENGRPFGATKVGTLRTEIAEYRAGLKGATDPEIIAEETAILDALLKAQKRIQTGRK